MPKTEILDNKDKILGIISSAYSVARHKIKKAIMTLDYALQAHSDSSCVVSLGLAQLGQRATDCFRFLHKKIQKPVRIPHVCRIS